MSNASKNDTDFYAWAKGQAVLLQEGRLSEADVEHMGRGVISLIHYCRSVTGSGAAGLPRRLAIVPSSVAIGVLESFLESLE